MTHALFIQLSNDTKIMKKKKKTKKKKKKKKKKTKKKKTTDNWKEEVPEEVSEKVQVGKDQEKAQSEKDSHSKNRGGKKPK